MGVTFVLLSPTWGMHQYTADLTNRIADCRLRIEDSPVPVRVVTTANAPRDRYAAGVELETPLTTHGTGFSREGLDLRAYRRTLAAILNQPSTFNLKPQATLQGQPSVHRESSARSQSSIFDLPSSIVHFTGVHAWNVPLVYALRRRGIPVIHTLHDLDPHRGVRFARLIRVWNRLIVMSGAHILVHGRAYRDRLLARGLPPERVTVTPLLHGFLSGLEPWPPHDALTNLRELRYNDRNPHVLFFGRIEPYKGVDVLLRAWGQMLNSARGESQPRLTIAGSRSPRVTLPPLPPQVTLREGRIEDEEAAALFRSADLLVLPYLDATQSALVAAAYAYSVPVVATRTGALGETIEEGRTGWLVQPGSVDDLGGCLGRALADRDRLARMGVAARAWFDRQRTAEAEALGALYTTIARCDC